MRRLGPALALVLLVVALPGCGGDDDRAAKDEPPAPELTVPRTEPADTTPTDTSTATDTAPSQDPSDAPGPAGEGDGSTQAPQGNDSPQNDTPPPSGSPAERFERECESRPGACG